MKKIFISMLLGISIVTCGFSKLTKENVVIASTINQSSKDEEVDMQQAIREYIPEWYDDADTTSQQTDRIFTLDELKKYDGKSGHPAYIGVDGVVYDVTNSKKWKSGKHCNVNAGNDLSKELGTSPHDKEALKKLPVVGFLK